MKQTLHIIASAAVAIAALTSCAKEQLKENAIPAGEPIEVSINGQIGEFTPADATKATAESVVRVTWGSGDNVFVYDGSNASIGTLTVTPDNNNASYAMLSGTITASSASPSKLTLVYVKGATEAPTIAGGKISVDLSTQNQAEVPFVLYTTVAYNADALTKTNEYISFDFATSVMTVNCTGLQTGASGAVEGITKAEIDGVSTRCELTIDGSGVTAVAGTTPGKITRRGTSVFTQSDSRGSFRLALAADPAAPAARNILVLQGSKVSGAAFTPTTLAAGKSYNTVYQMGEYISNGAGGYAPAVKVTGVTLAKEETTIIKGGKKTLVATVAPANATNKQITWSSSKPSVATVDTASGEVTGVAVGSAVITATTADGNFKAFCLVTVKTLPAGALNGVFTVADDGQGNVKTVYFSKGNLWYGKVGDAQTATFNFEANQYDYQSTWIDSHVSHFYWSKDASVAYEQSYSDENASVSDIFFTNDPTDSKKAKPDFTVNGVAGKYRTLSEDEWYYLLNKDTSNDIRKDKCKYNVTVCGRKKCTVLLPDNWDTSVILLSNFKTTTKYDETTTPKWSEMEAAGAVCLPAAGGRVTSTFFNAEEKGQYSSTNRSTDVSQGARARILVIESSGGAFSNLLVSNAFSVRLVTDAE